MSPISLGLYALYGVGALVSVPVVAHAVHEPGEKGIWGDQSACVAFALVSSGLWPLSLGICLLAVISRTLAPLIFLRRGQREEKR